MMKVGAKIPNATKDNSTLINRREGMKLVITSSFKSSRGKEFFVTAVLLSFGILMTDSSSIFCVFLMTSFLLASVRTCIGGRNPSGYFQMSSSSRLPVSSAPKSAVGLSERYLLPSRVAVETSSAVTAILIENMIKRNEYKTMRTFSLRLNQRKHKNN